MRIPWGKKAIPLKSSSLFNKTKHSEEWHHSIEATAGVLHPSDPKFPYGFMRNHTDTYLKKKGKINQADIDIRLAIIVTSHDKRDIAVAAAAHAMTAQSLRALLHADLNVMQGSYWGLKMWLQCLIAANNGNPASVTDLEAYWARSLLPFATQGPRAAEWYLAGVCRILRDTAIANMDVLPEYAMLMRRAIADFSTQLEGFKLRSQWAAAYEAVLWMVELAKASPVTTPPGHLLPEHILDAQFPAWRAWTNWRPNLERIKLFASTSSDQLAVVLDIIALEGPDMVTGVKSTLREGLIARYDGIKTFLRWRSIIIEVPERTQGSLSAILEKTARLLDTAIASSEDNHQERFELFRDLVVARPVTMASLDVFEATCRIPYTPENDIYNAVREVYNNRSQLDGQHVLALQHLTCAFNEDQSADLRRLLLQDWLRSGIEKCVQECHKAVLAHMGQGLPWLALAHEYHVFCTKLKASEHHWPPEYRTFKNHPKWPSLDDMDTIVQIYDEVQRQELKQDPDISKPAISKHEEPDTAKQTEGKVLQPCKDGRDKSIRHPLEENIEAYCVDRVLGGKAMSHSCKRTMAAIIHIWKSTSKPSIDLERRELAVLVSQRAGTDFILRCRCLAGIASSEEMLQPKTFVKDLLAILRELEKDTSQAIIMFIQLLASQKVAALHWKDRLHVWLDRQCQPGVFNGKTVLDHSVQTLKAAQWLSFMDSTEALCSDTTFSDSSNKTVPPILQADLLRWRKHLSNYAGTLTRLEAMLGDNLEPVQCLLTCHSWHKSFAVILDCLQKVEGKPVELLMQKIVSKLSKDADNPLELRECLLDIAIASPTAVEICYRIWDAKHGYLNIPGLPDTMQINSRGSLSRKGISRKSVPTHAGPSTEPQTAKPYATETNFTVARKVPSAVVDVMTAGWILNSDIGDRDRDAVASVAAVLGLCKEEHSTSVWNAKLKEAMAFWEEIENEILAEAMRLEALQKGLKAKDPKGTALLLKELGIADNSLLDDEIATLPAGVSDMVEKVGDNEVEISFPLASFTELQRGAMGIPEGANNILLRLSLHDMDERPPSFCTHFNNDEDIETLQHTSWVCTNDSRSPYENFCVTRQTAFAWQLHRIIHTQLRIGNVRIADLHRLVKEKMDHLGQACVACGVSHKAQKSHLRRATPCDMMSCARLWYQLPLDVRVPEIRTDIYAVDMMLTSVFAAAMSGRAEFLPSCPYGAEAVKAILNSLPTLTLVSHAVNVSAVLQSYHRDAEKLISWACVHHRGYVATATGLCKVPTMPAGTHQFILASASPKLEGDFVSKLGRPSSKTTVLFHGTTFDRLPAILAQGLRVCSGTSLQRTGAAHGKGIYMAEEPATSLIYSPSTTSWRNSGLSNMRLLLGCEVVGSGKSVSRGIHLITDERTAMVRYVFLMTNTSSTPIANHIVPAMASGMSALRTGAV
jgi:hypothetical protein